MHRFIDFNDEKTDSMLILELTDLAGTLTGSSPFEVEIQALSYLDVHRSKVYVSHFWNHRPPDIQKAGMMSDVFLRATGNFFHTDSTAIAEFRKVFKNSPLRKLGFQLLALTEDLRVEEICKRERPGTVRQFNLRREIYRSYFSDQYIVNQEKNSFTDVIFNLVYLLLNSPGIYHPAGLPAWLDRIYPSIREQAERFFDCTSTASCAEVCSNLISILEKVLQKDMINEYFHLTESDMTPNEKPEDRAQVEKSDEMNDEEDAVGEETAHDEQMGTWHRETEQRGNHYLNSALERGKRTDIPAGRETENEENEAQATARGKSKMTENNNYTRESDVKKVTNHPSEKSHFGKANENAIMLFRSPSKPDAQSIAEYNEMKKATRFQQRKLKAIIEKTLKKKADDERSNLKAGRLQKKLLPFFIEEHPKIFYKKEEPSRTPDAAFSLLVDCSASMFDKMEETKRGIALFHESLKSVSVPHNITGFWEASGTADKQPNYFHEVIEFQHSLQHKAGPEIMELEAEEDNRDGFAIRVVGEELSKRREEQKYLIVFSDGEPAAWDYRNNGIVDTHEAVAQMRKRGIEVFNIFLSDEGIDPGQMKVFQNIYGSRSIVAPRIDELPDILFPLLKRLLSRAL